MTTLAGRSLRKNKSDWLTLEDSLYTEAGSVAQTQAELFNTEDLALANGNTQTNKVDENTNAA